MSTHHRRHVRLDVDMPVLVSSSSWKEPKKLTTQDVSTGGLFLISDVPLSQGIMVEVSLPRLPGFDELVLRGRIVRVVLPHIASARGTLPGAGVQFDQLTPAIESRLVAFLDEVERRVGETPAVPQPVSSPEPEVLPPPRPVGDTPEPEGMVDIEDQLDLIQKLDAAYRTEDYKTAQRLALRLMAANPKMVKYEVAAHMSTAHLAAIEDPETAHRYYSRVIEIDPRHDEAVQALRELGWPREKKPPGLWKRLFNRGK